MKPYRSTPIKEKESQPYIELQGNWLAEAGFFCGDTVEISVDYSTLTLATGKSSVSLLESKVEGWPPKSRYDKCYLGYIVSLLIERDTEYEPITLKSPEDTYRFLRQLQYESREVALSIALDSESRVVTVYDVGKGDPNCTSFSTFEVLKSALASNSTDIILAHNHVNGIPKPSLNDLDSTLRLIQATKLVGITIHDHVIVGYNDYASLRDLGFIEGLTQAAKYRTE